MAKWKIILFIQKGFTLVEVLMALTIFSVFIMVFMSTQGYNISSSTRMKEELALHNLAEYKLNEALLAPPALNESRSEYIEEKSFEETKWANYSYKLEYKKLEIPNFGELISQDEAELITEENRNQELQKKIFQKVQENMERMIWQVEVTIIDKISGETYSLSTWIRNSKARVDLNLSL